MEKVEGRGLVLDWKCVFSLGMDEEEIAEGLCVWKAKKMELELEKPT